MTDVVCAGQLVLDCLIRNIDEKTSSSRSRKAESVSLHPGGDCLNESIILSRLGLKVTAIGALGDDAAGEVLLNALRSSGTDVSHITVKSSLTTPVCAITVDREGRRFSVNSAALRLDGWRLPAQQLPVTRALSLASCFRAPLDDPKANLAIARKARDNGALVFCDAKLPIYEIADIRKFSPFFSCVDYFFPNENEAGYYSSVDLSENCPYGNFEKAASFFLSLGVRSVIIKAGKRGCFFMNKTERMMLPALETKVIDTTGAGDCFVAGFICARLEGKSDLECLRFALAAAALAVGSEGATSGISRLEQVEEVYQRHFQHD